MRRPSARALIALVPVLGALGPVLVAIALAAFDARAEPSAEAHAGEPQPPDLLELVLLEAPAPEGLVTYEAIIKPGLDALVELELVTPAGRSFEAEGRRSRYQLRPGDAVRRKRVHAAPGERVRVRLSVLNEQGEAWLVIEKEQSVSAPPRDRARERVPVVRASPDGRKIVEYMDRDEAERRGLVLAPQTRTAPERPHPEAPPPEEEDDRIPERVLE